MSNMIKFFKAIFQRRKKEYRVYVMDVFKENQRTYLELLNKVLGNDVKH